MVEVEQRARRVQLLDHAGITPAVGRREVEQVPGLVGRAGCAVGLEHRARQALQQVDVARTEGPLGRQLEARRRALRQAEQTALERLGQLA